MDEARPRFTRDLAAARARADDAVEQVRWSNAVEGQAPMEEFIAEDRALRDLQRLEGFQAKGQVPVLVEVFVRGRTFSREIGTKTGRRKSPREVLSAAGRRIIDVYVEPPLAAEARIRDAYEQSEQEAHGARDRAHFEMEELRLGRLHRKVRRSTPLGTCISDRVDDVGARHLEAF